MRLLTLGRVKRVYVKRACQSDPLAQGRFEDVGPRLVVTLERRQMLLGVMWLSCWESPCGGLMICVGPVRAVWTF